MHKLLKSEGTDLCCKNKNNKLAIVIKMNNTENRPLNFTTAASIIKQNIHKLT